MSKRPHAIVLGSSMSGLINAAVLVRHFECVTLIERDAIDVSTTDRKGVPQGKHVHGFWARGMAVLDDLLPGLSAELEAGGAVHGDSGRDFVWHQFDVTKLREPVGIPATLMTRPFLEAQLRRRVLALPQVRLLSGTSVRGLLTSDDNSRVRGVRITLADGSSQELLADLVLDATGRAGLTPRWLQELGYAAPQESKVKIDVCYVSRAFKRSRPCPAIAQLLVSTPPLGKRGGVAFAVEGDRWLLTLVGFLGEEPPTDHEGFLRYARSLPLPAMYEIASSAEAIGDFAKFKFPHNLRRHYEKLTRFPQGLLVTGDALTSFNPAYGQGMTVAALEAELLASELARTSHPAELAPRFFRRAAKIIDVPWSMTTGEDLRYPEAVGARPLGLGLLNAYVARMHRVAATDREVCKAFFRVAGFEAKPESLFAPRIAWRILRGPVKHPVAAQAARGEPQPAAAE